MVTTKQQLSMMLNMPVAQLESVGIVPSYCECQALNYLHNNGIIKNGDQRILLSQFDLGDRVRHEYVGEDASYEEMLLRYRFDKHKAILCDELAESSFRALNKHTKLLVRRGYGHEVAEDIDALVAFYKEFVDV